MIPDYWACSCHAYFDVYDLARAHSRAGHDVISLEYRDGRDARYKTELECEQNEVAA